MERIQIGLLLSSAILSLVTIYYAVINHKIMSFNKKILELEKRPYLNFERVVTKHFSLNNENSFQIGVEFRNVSIVHLKYDVTQFKVSLENMTLHEPKFLNKCGYLYPNQSIIFDYAAINGIIIDENKILRGKIEYEIEYYFEKNRRFKTKRILQIVLFPKELCCEWKFEYEEEL